MQSGRPGEKVGLGAWLPVGFVAVLTLLVVLGWGSYANVQRIIVHTTWVRHTVDVQNGVNEVYADVAAAESQQRGYLLNGTKDYLSDFDSYQKDAFDRSEWLVGYVADNPREVNRAKEFESLVHQRFAIMKGVLAAFDKGGLALTRKQFGLRGPILMKQLKAKAEEIISAEDALLVLRTRNRDQSIRQATLTFAISGIITIVLLTTLYVVLHRFLNEQIQQRALAEEHRRELQIQIAEKERAERELQRSNRELQDFAFVASHDLQEPLRKIQAFGDRLRSKNASILDETSLDYLSRMQNAANRMQELINALLNLSRITTKAQPFTSVDLNVVLETALEDLQRRVEETGGKVILGGLPSLEADRVQMRQLFQNLVGNALKFRAPDRPPLVEVRQAPSPDPEMVRVTVKDNGIGFEERHAEKIFAVFQRLHGRGEYEGSGIGLAICRRIVDRHGGKIVAESVPGEGATFVIDLPKRQPETSP